MNFSIVRDVKEPERGTKLSAGIDFFVPNFDKQFLSDLKEKNKNEIESNNIEINQYKIYLKPHGRILIPAGIHVNLDSLCKKENMQEGYGLGLFVHNKSGIGTKKGFDRLAEVIDQDYKGEIHISIVNTSTITQEIIPGEKLVQMILMPVLYSTPKEVSLANLYKNTDISERGIGGFGSTGNK